MTKKNYFKRLIEKIQTGIWDMELRIDTMNDIREGIRREFDVIQSKIKAFEQEEEKLLGELGIDIGKREEIEQTRKTYKPEELMGLNEETQREFEERANKQTRAMRTKLIEDWSKEKDKDKAKTIVKAIEFKQGLETDATHMQEQMMGKWSEKMQSYQGGIDQEIAVVKNKIEGGEAFKDLVEKKLKKL